MQRIIGIDPGLVATGYAVIESDGLPPDEFEITLPADPQIELTGAGKLLRLLDALADLDDVQNVYCNASLAAEAARA